MRILARVTQRFVLILIRVYQLAVSPLFPPSCRHTPSCSRYMVEAIEHYGTLKGLWLGLKRLGRCHPWGGHGFDPIDNKR